MHDPQSPCGISLYMGNRAAVFDHLLPKGNLVSRRRIQRAFAQTRRYGDDILARRRAVQSVRIGTFCTLARLRFDGKHLALYTLAFFFHS